MLDKIVFRQSHGFFLLFFYSACFFDIISSMSPQVLAKYFNRVGSHVVSVRIHCTEKWRTSFLTDVLSKSK